MKCDPDLENKREKIRAILCRKQGLTSQDRAGGRGAGHGLQQVSRCETVV